MSNRLVKEVANSPSRLLTRKVRLDRFLSQAAGVATQRRKEKLLHLR